jgi:hypothetical protein
VLATTTAPQEITAPAAVSKEMPAQPPLQQRHPTVLVASRQPSISLLLLLLLGDGYVAANVGRHRGDSLIEFFVRLGELWSRSGEWRRHTARRRPNRIELLPRSIRSVRATRRHLKRHDLVTSRSRGSSTRYDVRSRRRAGESY